MPALPSFLRRALYQWDAAALARALDQGASLKGRDGLGYSALAVTLLPWAQEPARAVAQSQAFAQVLTQVLASDAQVNVPAKHKGTKSSLPVAGWMMAAQPPAWVLEQLVTAGADVRVTPETATLWPASAQTPTLLHQAARVNAPALIDCLVRHHWVGVDAVGLEGLTPFDVAVQRGHLAAMDRLHAAGARLTHFDDDDHWTDGPYVAALQAPVGHRLPAIEWLLDHQVPTDTRNEFGTPMVLSLFDELSPKRRGTGPEADEAHAIAARVLPLLNVHAMDERESSEGETLLVLAARHGDWDLAEQVLRQGLLATLVAPQGPSYFSELDQQTEMGLLSEEQWTQWKALPARIWGEGMPEPGATIRRPRL